jgi:hypothetical protein
MVAYVLEDHVILFDNKTDDHYQLVRVYYLK